MNNKMHPAVVPSITHREFGYLTGGRVLGLGKTDLGRWLWIHLSSRLSAASCNAWAPQRVGNFTRLNPHFLSSWKCQSECFGVNTKLYVTYTNRICDKTLSRSTSTCLASDFHVSTGYRYTGIVMHGTYELRG